MRDRHLYCIRTHGDVVYIAGEEGLLLHSANAGRTFSVVHGPYAGSYFGVIPLGEEGLVVHGMQGNAYRSPDGGRHWEKIDTGTKAGLTAGMALSDGSVLLASQAGEVLQVDQRARIRALPLARTFPIAALSQADDGAIVAVGSRGVLRIPPRQGGQ